MFLRVRSDQPIQIMTLEFVRIARERNKVAHAVIACSRAKRNLMLRCKGAQRGIAASAAAADHQTVRVGVAIRCQVASPADAVLNVENAPLPLQPKPVRTAVSRAPAVVHIEHTDATAGPKLPRHRKRARCRCGWAPCGAVLLRKRGIEKRVGGLPALSGKRYRLRP